MRAVVTLAIKDLRLLLRDKPGLFWVLFFPFLMALFFGAIFSGSGGGARSLKVATVQDNTAPLALQFYDELTKSEVLDVIPLPRDSARTLVMRGSIVASIEFGSSAGSFSELFADRSAAIEVSIDPSRRAEAGYLIGLINQAYFAMLQSALNDNADWRAELRANINTLDTSVAVSEQERETYRRFLSSLDSFLENLNNINVINAAGSGRTGSSDSVAVGGSPATAFGGLNVSFTDVAATQNRPRSSFEITFPLALQWALIGTAAAFALSIVIERTRGTFLRLRLAPISRAHILAGKGLACFIACVAVCAVLMVIGVVVFGVRISSPLGLLIAVTSSAVCAVGLMMLVSVLGKTEASVAGVGWAVFLVFAMIGGGMVPLIVMPGWMASLSNFSPIKWSILATEGAVWRNFGVVEMARPIAVLLGIGLCGYSIGVWVMRKSDG